MAKWRVKKEPTGIFKWKATSPDGKRTMRTISFSLAIEKVHELIKGERQAMTKTLADMTAEEREECVGMWASIENAEPAVIVEAGEEGTCVVIYPELLGVTAVHLNEMVPRVLVCRVHGHQKATQ